MVQLHFPEGVESAGFSSSTTSNAADADATTIIRELIQNSVDAAKEISREQSVIRFHVEKLRQNHLPGINDLRDSFPRALETQEQLNDGVLPAVQHQVAMGLQDSIFSDLGHVMSVSDNGVGLTQRTMRALLSDGQSAKSSAGGGAHGYGHLTVIPASDMRLVYYGGIHETEGVIASGHCILAPFKDQTDIFRTKDGYLVQSLMQDLFNPYDFIVGNDVPEFISKKIESIKKLWGSGTVVIIPAFNFFKDEQGYEELWKAIEYSAATNFFASIFKDEITIEYECEDGKWILNAENLEDALIKNNSEKRGAKFLPGYWAHECHDVIKAGEDIEFVTDLGPVIGKLHRSGRGRSTRIDLCRNGMWIVSNTGNSLPMLQNNTFSDYESFHLVLLLEASDGEIHDLVRASEPPIHDQVDIKRLQESERNKLRYAFKQIQEQLKSRLAKIDTETFAMDGILSLPIGGSGSGGEVGVHAGEWKPFDRHPRASTGSKEIDEGEEKQEKRGTGKKKGKKSQGGGTKTIKRTGNAIPFEAIPVPLGTRKFEIEIHPLEDISSGEIRFMIDQNFDETSNQMNSEPFVKINNARLNDKPISKSQHMKTAKGDVILISDMKEGEPFNLKFDFDLPANVVIGEDRSVSLKTEIIKRRSSETEVGDG